MLWTTIQNAILVSMIDLYSAEPDFEAEITILRVEEGGRTVPPHNYIRWDFGYAEDNPLEPRRNLSANIYMIYPNFLNEDGVPIPKGVPLNGTYNAYMHILVRDMVDYHQSRLSVGTNFNCHEGSRIVARGTVTKLRAISP
ncbi:hypothetical protein MED193_21946 [Roseobacter sp. MED193]|nr:hypothetical protein MED193_21946 [Roseobacter sp. MED193]